MRHWPAGQQAFYHANQRDGVISPVISGHFCNRRSVPLNKMVKFLKMIDFGHTLFGLPFAYLGSFLAISGIPSPGQLGWITLAISARTSALCLNRIIDRHLDQANPRTAHWVMASGQLPLSLVWGAVVVGLILLFLAASQLNPLCVKLAPLAVLVLWGYSYTKRFTWWCHVVLGLAIGMGPVGAWMAVTGRLDWQPILLSLAVACWVAGFDITYACQDIEFDRKHGLYSVPARFGIKGAFRFSEVLHLLMVLFLIAGGLALSLGGWYYIGVAIAAIILLYEHKIVTPENMSRVNFASFKINRYVGLLIFMTTLADILS
jgi:4-hydroxybenzoate polyprenyltransferase